jgi:glyoxylase-like metal-dependent hydrolase (beta-lactamase superfamily II)
MDSVTLTPNLTMLRVHGWQVYPWRDGDSATLIDTGAPGSGTDILTLAPAIDRIVLTHGHVDHSHTEGSIAIHLPRHGVLFTATPSRTRTA